VQAGEELERCVKSYGFLGAILNDFQNVNEDVEAMQFYDQPEYDPFWKKAVELDVPVYLHPRTPIPSIAKALYSQRPWLNGAGMQFMYFVGPVLIQLSNSFGICRKIQIRPL